jgi:lipoyl(octanoyl) transferase
MARHRLVVRPLGPSDYEATVAAMRRFTEDRGPATPDELWLLEHPPVFTLGRAADPAHVLDPGDIPVVRTDRGGQVTYHGPGQLVAYALIDLQRRGLGIRPFVRLLEQAVIDLLADRGIEAGRRAGAPGVYVRGRKIAALGLRVRRGCTYHGLSLNLDLDLAPFRLIEPCGYPGLAVTRLADLAGDREMTLHEAGDALAAILARRIGYNGLQWERGLAPPAAAPLPPDIPAQAICP